MLMCSLYRYRSVLQPLSIGLTDVLPSEIVRPSPLRHPVAVLRQIIGLGQAELAALCGNSDRTIQAVELRKLALSERLARKIAHATGVSVGWLLNGDPTAPPIADSPAGIFSPGAAYTHEVYEAHRAFQEVEDRAAAGGGRENSFAQIHGSLEFGRELERRDAELVALCRELLERTRDDEQRAVIRWKLKGFLLDLSARYVGTPSWAEAQQEQTSSAARGKKSASRAGRRGAAMNVSAGPTR